MTKILLNSPGFVIEVIFFYILPFSYRGKNCRRRKMTKFGRGDENFPRRKILPHEIFPDKVIVFSEICCDVVENTHCYQFLCKVLKGFP